MHTETFSSKKKNEKVQKNFAESKGILLVQSDPAYLNKTECWINLFNVWWNK